MLRPCEAEVGTTASVSAPVAGERGWGDVCRVLLSSHNHSPVGCYLPVGFLNFDISESHYYKQFFFTEDLLFVERMSGLCQPSPPWWRWTRCGCSPCWCWAASSPPRPPSAATSPGGSTGADRGQQSRRTPGMYALKLECTRYVMYALKLECTMCTNNYYWSRGHCPSILNLTVDWKYN